MDKQFESALDIVKALHAAGYQAVFAGGCVRDQLMGESPHDYDIATSAYPHQVQALFPTNIEVGKAFGVVVVIQEGMQFEVATFREDMMYLDGRRPSEIRFATMEADANRRDLTINGIFYDPIAGEYYDYVGGTKDIENKIIRFIGDPEERILEDHLRLMRAIRFKHRLGFSMDTITEQAISGNSHLIQLISVERIADELTKILEQSKIRGDALKDLGHFGILQHILPEVQDMDGCEQPEDYHPEGDVFKHTCKALNSLPEDASPELLWGTLLHDVGKPPMKEWDDKKGRLVFNRHDIKGAYMTKNILTRLKFSNDFIDRVCSLVENHMKFCVIRDMRKSTLKRFVAMDRFEEHLQLHRADCLASHGGLDNLQFVKEAMDSFAEEPGGRVVLPDRLVDGNDLIAMGFKPGPKFKEILETVDTEHLEGTLENKEQALLFIKEKYKG